MHATNICKDCLVRWYSLFPACRSAEPYSTLKLLEQVRQILQILGESLSMQELLDDAAANNELFDGAGLSLTKS
jgi:hypothetical protein